MLNSQKQLTDLMIDYLSDLFNCSKEDLLNEDYKQVFIEEKNNSDRPSFNIMTTGNTIVVKATAKRLRYFQSRVHGLDRDAIFSLPFIRGHYHHYIPKISSIPSMSLANGYIFKLLDADDEISELLKIKGFDNALIYDKNHKRTTDIATVVKFNNEIVGIASGSKVRDKVWQLGVDVKEGHRNKGIAFFLICNITKELLSRGILPLYDVLSSNLNSHRVAMKSGYQLGWITDWKCFFEDEKLD